MDVADVAVTVAVVADDLEPLFANEGIDKFDGIDPCDLRSLGVLVDRDWGVLVDRDDVDSRWWTCRLR